MGNVIYKYRIEVREIQTLRVPEISRVLDLQVQCEQAAMWMLVDPNSKMREFKVRTYGTGESIPTELPLVHLGTYQNAGSVRHVFEEREA